MGVYVVMDQKALSEAVAELRSFEGAEMEKRIRAATLAGARSLVAPVKEAAPRKTGALAASTKVAAVKADGKWIGYRVRVGGKGARQANIIVGGSKAHTIRGKVGHPLGLPFGPRAFVHVHGVRANPYVARTGRNEGDRVLTAMGKSIARSNRARG